MRDLTPEELALAPEWATHYFILSDDLIQFESELYYAKVNSKTKNSSKVQCNKEYGIAGVKIPFYITQYEWSDEAKDCRILFNNPSWAGDDLQIEVSDANGNYADALLIKEHAIAIAKHFKLTAEDLG